MRSFPLFALFVSLALFAEVPRFEQLVVVGDRLDGVSSLEMEVQQEFSGQEITKEILDEIRNRVVAAYQKQDRPFVLVDIPEQDVSRGVVEMRVSESTLSGISCEGNRWFRCARLAGYLRLNEGETIDLERVRNGLAFANRNPFRSVSAFFKPGSERHSTEIILLSKERFPLRLYTGADNTGNDFTGNARIFGGTTIGNLTTRDDILSYQYTTSNKPHQFQSHTAQYQIPLPKEFLLMAFGGVSFVHAHLSQFTNQFLPLPTRISNKGFSAQASVRLQIPFGAFGMAKLQEATFGFDFKRMNNNLIYIGDTTIPLIFKNVNLGQFVGCYSIAQDTGKHRFSFENEVFFSPGNICGGGSDSEFGNLRNRARNVYGYGRLAVQDTYQLPRKFCLYGLLRGQWASGALLPSEQMGLGGYDTVRGYDEREFNADQAVVFNGEFHFPTGSFIKQGTDAFFVLLFADFAAGWNYSSLSNEETSDWLASGGAGFRYHIDRYLDARLDYGFKLHKDSVLGTSLGKLHVGLVANY